MKPRLECRESARGFPQSGARRTLPTMEAPDTITCVECGAAAGRLTFEPGGQVEHRERGVGPLDRVEREGEVERGLGADGERLRRLVLRQDDAGEEPVVGRGQPLPDLRHRHPPRRAGPAAGGEQGEDQDQEQGFTVRG